MADTFDILRKLALQVRNATLAGENSAERVGRILWGYWICCHNFLWMN